jgi:hypothetical protein
MLTELDEVPPSGPGILPATVWVMVFSKQHNVEKVVLQN